MTKIDLERLAAEAPLEILCAVGTVRLMSGRWREDERVWRWCQRWCQLCLTLKAGGSGDSPYPLNNELPCSREGDPEWRRGFRRLWRQAALTLYRRGVVLLSDEDGQPWHGSVPLARWELASDPTPGAADDIFKRVWPWLLDHLRPLTDEERRALREWGYELSGGK